MKVWVVMYYNYSDSGLSAIFTTRKDADDFAKRDPDNHVQEEEVFAGPVEWDSESSKYKEKKHEHEEKE